MSLIVLEGSNGSGKTTVINILKDKYELTDKKSIPDWYRKYIIFARKCPLKLQKMIYLLGHYLNYKDSLNNNCIFDRFYYSTIIRINYELGISIEDTVKEITNIKYIPDLVIVLKSKKEDIQKRLNNRNNFEFNDSFYNYENKVFEQLSIIFDILYIVNNIETLDYVVSDISNIIDNNSRIKRR